MRRLTVTLIVALLIVVAVAIVRAQEATPESMIGIPACDYATLGTGLGVEGEALAGQEDPAERVLIIQAGLATFRAECDGYTFTQEEYGASVVSDPIIFRDGVYRARLTSDPGGAAVTIEPLEGDCGFAYVYVLSAGGESQELFRFTGCVGILTVDAREESNWSMAMEPIAQGE